MSQDTILEGIYKELDLSKINSLLTVIFNGRDGVKKSGNFIPSDNLNIPYLTKVTTNDKLEDNQIKFQFSNVEKNKDDNLMLETAGIITVVLEKPFWTNVEESIGRNIDNLTDIEAINLTRTKLIMSALEAYEMHCKESQNSTSDQALINSDESNMPSC